MRKSDHNYPLARQQRRQQTLPEGLLWRELKARKSGLKFRRQHPVGPYVIDLYCAAAKVGFEIDGIAHDMGNAPERDLRRNAFLATQGIVITRIAARDVLTNPQAVAESIVRDCAAATPPSRA